MFTGTMIASLMCKTFVQWTYDDRNRHGGGRTAGYVRAGAADASL